MEQTIKSYVLRHIKKYPKIETIDIYKLLFQATHLAGHLISDKAYEYLKYEANKVSNKLQDNELYEYISDEVVRVNLYPYLNYYSLESLFDLFKKSSLKTQSNDLLIKYKDLVKDMMTVENRVLEYLVNDGIVNKCIPSHSIIYKRHYNPSYRIALAKDLSVDLRVKKLQNYIDLLNEKNNRYIVSLEGRCASGKTTLSKELKNITLIHVDDFFDEKGLERLNYKDLKSFLERIKNANIGDKIIYKAFSCRNWSYYEKEILVSKVIVVEGVYSYSEEIRSYFDKLVFSVISKEEQLNRLQRRESEKYLQKYLNIWIPREEEYYKTFDFVSNADILI